jgi:hypothetical protein
VHLRECVEYTVDRLSTMLGVKAYTPEASFVVRADVSSLLYSMAHEVERDSRISGDGEKTREEDLCDFLVKHHRAICCDLWLQQVLWPRL